MNDPRFARLRSPDAGEGSGGPPRRSSSVQIQPGGGPARTDDAEAMTDPANQSLADALRVLMYILQGAMLILVVLYLASGVRTVKEGYGGVRVLFGEKRETDLEPGAAWSAPYPFGEMVSVFKGSRRITIDRDFWQFVEPGGDSSAEKLPPKPSLKPGEGGTGSLITADGNIVHAKWSVDYSVENVGRYAQNIPNVEEETRLIRAAVKRGIVQATASVPVEEMLKQVEGQTGMLQASAKRIAQDMLNSVNSGLVIDQLSPIDIIPPTYVKASFAKVQSAVANANKAKDDARAAGKQTLLAAAGQAGPYLVRQLDLYEAAAARLHAAEGSGVQADIDAAKREMAGVLGVLDAIMRGDDVDLPAGTVSVAGEPRVLAAGKAKGLAGGRVADVLAQATAYRSSVVNRAKAEEGRFAAKLEQFTANPRVMVYREWSGAVSAFLGRPGVIFYHLPPGTGTLNLMLNQDPDLVREQQKAQKERESEEAKQRRMEEMKKQEFKTETGTQTLSG